MSGRGALVLLALVSSAVALRLSADDQEWKERPVAKVVKMLKDMQDQLEDEAKNDQELYDKLVCWCETNEKEKTKAIELANQQIKDVTAAIDEYTSKDKRLTTDIAALNAETVKNKKALDDAAAIRAKELAEFNKDESDMIASIGSLKGAVITLSKQNPGASALQREALTQVTNVLRRKLKTNPSLVTGAVAPHRRHILTELLQRPDGIFALLQQPVAASSYNPASGEIFGMLKQMKETFETNLESSKSQEATAAKAFAELKSAKESELKAAGDKLFNMQADHGTTREKNAQAKEDLSNTEDALEADTEFLANLKKKCAVTDADWDARSKMRQEEILAVSETISILDNDEAHDQMSKSLGLVQLRAEAMRDAAKRAQAVKFLQEAGARLHSPRVSYLATRMRFDPFGKMRDSLDTMVVGLDKEKSDEIHLKDECVSDLNTNEKETTAKNENKDDLEAEINTLNAEEEQLTDETQRLAQEISDMQKNLKTASADRETENKDFQEVISDQRATRAILQKAVERLGAFYNKKAALVQQRSATAKQVPGAPVEAMPAGFADYKKGAGGGALAMINQIIADSSATEQDATTSEVDAQAAYESFVKDTNKSIKKKNEQIAADSEEKSADEVEEAHDEADKRATTDDILKLADMNQAIHSGCDFTLNNFEERQESRDHEVEALKQAKAIFSGAGFGR